MKAALFVLISLSVTVAQADYSAILYDQATKREKQLGTMEVKITPAGNQESVTTVYKDVEGKILVEEKGILQGNDLVKLEIDHKQLGQQGLIEVKEGQVYFSKTSDGKTTTKNEKLGATLVASTNFQKFIKKNWEAILSGSTVSFRYAVWDRQETVGFEIFKIGSEKVGADEAVVLKMKPSSFIIAALVKPLLFKYSADGSRILEMNGRVPPKKKDGSTFKDLDAEVVYHYSTADSTAPGASAAPQPSTAPTAPADKRPARAKK